MLTMSDQPRLTKEDLQAIRQADTISFHTFDGRTWLRTNRATRDRNGITVDVAEREIEANVAWTDYGADYANSNPRFSQGFAMISASTFNETWTTIARLLKVDDAITLHWVAENNNGYIESAGLHHDELRLVVRRVKGQKVEKLVFVVDTSLCEDNSARMVKR